MFALYLLGWPGWLPADPVPVSYSRFSPLPGPLHSLPRLVTQNQMVSPVIWTFFDKRAFLKGFKETVSRDILFSLEV